MHDNHIFLDLRFSKEKIHHLLDRFTDQWYKTTLQTDGYNLDMSKVEGKPIEVHAQNRTLYMDVPVGFRFIKPAGLFSIEGEATILLKLRLDFDISSDFQVKVVSAIDQCLWIIPPVMKMGKPDIQDERFTECIIQFLKSETLDKLDLYLAEKANILPLIHEQIKTYGRNYMISKKPDLFFNVNLSGISAGKLVEIDRNIQLNMWLEVDTKISDELVRYEYEIEPYFKWIEDAPDTHQQLTEIQFSYYGLGRIIMNALNGTDIGGKTFDIENIHIRNTSFLEIQARIREPIKGMVIITGVPLLDRADQLIHVNDMKVQVEAENFIYKLSSPIIEKILLNKLQGFFPFDAAPFFAGYISKIPAFHFLDNQLSLTPNVDKVHVKDLVFGEQHATCTLVIQNAELEIVLQHHA
jgi:hypothetical protein